MWMVAEAKATVIVDMGVSRSGKSTVAPPLAGALDWAFRDGDDLHPISNLEKMRAGSPLTDTDRWPWLVRVAKVIDGWRTAEQRGVIACSALKRANRDLIIRDRTGVGLVYLRGSAAMIAARLAGRRGHCMPPALFASQFEAPEPPGPD